MKDLRRFCARILDARLHRWGAHLPPALHEDALSFLMLTAIELERRYDPRVGRLSGWLGFVLPLRVATWYRRELADVRSGEQPAMPVAELDELEDVGARDFEERMLERDAARSMLGELSPAGMETVRQVVVPLVAGANYQDIEAATGLAPSTSTRLVRRVRAELVGQYLERTRGDP